MKVSTVNSDFQFGSKELKAIKIIAILLWILWIAKTSFVTTVVFAYFELRYTKRFNLFSWGMDLTDN